MGQKIYKSTLMSQIQQKITACQLYQQQSPDQLAKKRVQTLDKNPCNDGKYYAVMTLNGALSETSTDPQDLWNARETKFLQIPIKDYDKIFACGCIIKYNLKNDSVTVDSYQGSGQLVKIFENLITQAQKSGTKLLRFQPSKGNIFNSFIKNACLKDDYDAYKDDYETLVYSIGRFNNIQSYLSGYITDSEKHLSTYTFPFQNVSYVNSTRLTSFQKNVNSQLNESVMNKVTNLAQKTELGNISLKNEKVYDFSEFVLNCLARLQNSDNRIISSEAESSGSNKSTKTETAKYNAYKAFGGNSQWEDIKTATNVYLTFKSLSSNSQFYQNAMKNASYKNNIFSYQKTSFLFNNNYQTVKYQFQNSFSKQFNVSTVGSSDAKNYISSHLIQPIHYVVKGQSGSPQVCFNKDISYTVIVPVKEDDKGVKSSQKTGDSFVYLADKDTDMIKAKYILKGENIKQIQRSSITIDGTTYDYSDSAISFTDGTTVKDETQNKNGNQVPTASYYSSGLKAFFTSKNLIKKITQIKISYAIVPQKVKKQIKSYCVKLDEKHYATQYKQTAQKALQKQKKKRGKLVLRAVVDTIPYDPWQKAIKKLKQVYYAYAKIPENKDGYIIVPSAEQNLAKQKDSKCKKCGKTKDKCQCEDVKLCDKIFPVDFFGVTGLLGLDSLLSKFGLFSAKAYVLDQQDKKLTYAELAQYLYWATSSTYSWNDLSLFQQASNTANQVANITFDQLKNSSQYSIVGSPANQLSKTDLQNFISQYKTLLSNKNYDKIKKESFARQVKIGIADGYSYIPIGQTIQFQYNLMTNKFGPVGATAVPGLTQLCTDLIQNKTGTQYVDAASGLIIDNQLMIGQQNAKKWLCYPYIPNILAILGQSNQDNQDQPDEYGFQYMYIPKPESVKDLIASLATPGNKIIKFDIYTKQPIKCGFPKKQKPKCRGNSSYNGKCGLQELFNTPIVLSSAKFDPKKQIMNLKSKTIKSQMKKALQNFKKNMKRLKDFACDIEGNLKSLSEAKNDALDVLYTFGKQMAPIMNLFPLKCLTDAYNDGKNAICSASRQAQDTSTIDDFSQSVTHKLKTAQILTNQVWTATKTRFNNITSGLQNAVGPIASSVKNLYDNASIYNLCPERFGDYISDSGIAKSFGQGLTGLMKTNILDIMKNIIGSCMVDGIIDATLGGVNSITQAQKAQIKKIIQNADPDGIQNLGKRFPQLLDKFGNGNGGIDMNKLLSDPLINTDFLESFNTQLTKRLSPADMMSSVTDKFTQPDVLINFAKNGVKSVLTGGLGNMTQSLMNYVKGVGVDQINGQLQGNINGMFSSSSRKNIQSDILTTTDNFIKQKAELYSQINQGNKIPNLDI